MKSPSASGSGDSTPTWFHAELLVGFLNRSLTYDGKGSANVRPHHASALVAGFDLTAFPGVPFFSGWLARLGLQVDYWRSPELGTRIAGADADSPTVFDAAKVRAIARIALGPIELWPYLGWGMERASMAVTARDPFRDEVPAVAYQSLCFGTAARWPIDDFEAQASVGYRLHLAKGRIGDEYFPDSSTVAVEMSLGVSYFLFEWLSFDAGAVYSPTFYQLEGDVRDPYVAQSARDHLLLGRLGATYHL
jgi:hypothetical protein